MFTFRPLRGIGDRGSDAWLPAHPVFHYGLSPMTGKEEGSAVSKGTSCQNLRDTLSVRPTQLRSCSWNGNNSAAAAAKTINVDKWFGPRPTRQAAREKKGPSSKSGVCHLKDHVELSGITSQVMSKF